MNKKKLSICNEIKLKTRSSKLSDCENEFFDNNSLVVPDHDILNMVKENMKLSIRVGTTLKSLQDNILCRENETEMLYNIIGQAESCLPPNIFIYGHEATGKSYVIQKMLQSLNHKYVFVDCVQCYLPKLIYFAILQEVTGHVLNEDNNFTTCFSCNDILDFITYFKSNLSHRSFFIILKNCERLRDFPKTVLPALLRLQEITRLNVCVILISKVTPEKFYSQRGYFETIPIHFRQYTKDEVYRILSQNHPWKDEDSVYKNYLSLFLSVFYTSCRDLRELQYMVNANFEKHLNAYPINKMSMQKLWQTIMPQLKRSLAEIYQRTVSSSEKSKEHLEAKQALTSKEYALSFELPYYTKYFLIAAYLASYIPSKMDKSLFVKLSSKKKKRVNRSKDDVLSDMLLGPKPFSADRLLAIFYSIVDGKVTFTADLSAQISTLTKLRLLSIVNSSIDMPKYKCSVGLDFIRIIGRTVGFDVMKFLFPSK